MSEIPMPRCKPPRKEYLLYCPRNCRSVRKPLRLAVHFNEVRPNAPKPKPPKPPGCRSYNAFNVRVDSKQPSDNGTLHLWALLPVFFFGIAIGVVIVNQGVLT